MNNYDWKLASIIGMFISLGFNVFIESSPLAVFISLLIIPTFNYLLHLWGCKIVHGKWNDKAYIREWSFSDRPFYVIYYTLDGEDKSRYFFGDDGKKNAEVFLEKLKESSCTIY